MGVFKDKTLLITGVSIKLCFDDSGRKVDYPVAGNN